MKYAQAYGAVSNLIADYESLLQLRPFLEAAKDAEEYTQQAQSRISGLDEEIDKRRLILDSLKKEESSRRSEMDKVERTRIAEIQKRIADMDKAASHERSERLEELDSKIEDNSLKLLSLESSCKAREEELRKLDADTIKAKHELKTVRDNLTAIKNSIGG